MLAETLQFLYPNIDLERECILEHGPNGAYIASWNRTEQQPTIQEIEAAYLVVRLGSITSAIKEQARKRILAVLPEWKQANATARAVEMVASGQASGPEWEAMQTAWAWVKAIREYSNSLEQQAAQMSDPTLLDIYSGWPELKE